MNIKKSFMALGIAGAVVAGGSTAVLAAGNADGLGPKATFVCDHLEEIQGQMSLRHQLLEGRLNLLNEAKAGGLGGARIDTRIARTTAAITRNEKRTAKLAEWAPEHCTA